MPVSIKAMRLKEGADLRQSISQFAKENDLKNATIISTVGSLSKVKLRMAGAQPDYQDVREYEGVYEIVSITGTVAQNGDSHIHISISDKEGRVVGGHLKDGSIIHTTVELVVISDDKLIFSRDIDSQTGFEELGVAKGRNE